MNLINNRWIDTNVKAGIKPPPIPLIRAVTEKVAEYNIIKIKMRRGPASATSKIYELKSPSSKMANHKSSYR